MTSAPPWTIPSSPPTPGNPPRNTSADPDAGHHIREHEPDDDPEGKRKKDRPVITEVKWGYEAALVVSGTTHQVDDRLAHPPRSAASPPPVPASNPPAPRSPPCVTPPTVAGSWAAGRRPRLQQPTTREFQLPASALGFGLLFDYRRDQLGIQAEHAGAAQIEGRLYCPHMPEPLVTASIDRRAKTIDPDTYAQRIIARRAYELRPNNSWMPKGTSGCSAPPPGRRRPCGVR